MSRSAAPRSSTSTSSRTARACSKLRRSWIDSTAPTRGTPARDFRMQVFAEAVDALVGPGDRLTRIQLLLSDPTTEPLERLDRKSALGAYDRWKRGGALVRYIDHHAHMVSRTTDDYQQMALTGCVGDHRAGVLGRMGSQLRRQRRRLFPPAHRVRAAPRRAVRDPALHVAGREPEGIGRPRSLPRRAETHPEVPGSPDGARHRRDRPQPRHAQRDRHLHGAGRAGDRAPPADPDSHAASRRQATKGPASPSMCSAATARSSPRA